MRMEDAKEKLREAGRRKLSEFKGTRAVKPSHSAEASASNSQSSSSTAISPEGTTPSEPAGELMELSEQQQAAEEQLQLHEVELLAWKQKTLMVEELLEERNKQLDSAAKAVSEAKNRAADLEEEMDHHKNLAHKHALESQEARDTSRKLQERLALLSTMVEENIGSRDDHVTQLQEQLEASGRQVLELEAKLGDTVDKLSSVREYAQSSSEELTISQEALAALQNKMDRQAVASEEGMQALKNRIKELELEAGRAAASAALIGSKPQASSNPQAPTGREKPATEAELKKLRGNAAMLETQVAVSTQRVNILEDELEQLKAEARELREFKKRAGGLLEQQLVQIGGDGAAKQLGKQLLDAQDELSKLVQKLATFEGSQAEDNGAALKRGESGSGSAKNKRTADLELRAQNQNLLQDAAALEEQVQTLSQAKTELECLHQKALAESRDKLRAAVKKGKSIEKELEASKAALDELQRMHDAEVVELRAVLSEEAEETRRVHGMQIGELQKQHTAELNELRQTQADSEHPVAELERLKREHLLEVEDMKRLHTIEMDKVLRQMAADASSNELDEVKQLHARQVEEMGQAHAREVKDMQGNHDREIDEMRQLHSHLNDLRSGHADAAEQITRLKAALEAAQKVHEADQKVQEDLRSGYTDAAAQITQLQAALEAARKVHEADQKVQGDLKNLVEEGQERLRQLIAELEAARKVHEADQKVQEELKQLVEEEQDRLRQLSAELEDATAEADQLRNQLDDAELEKSELVQATASLEGRLVAARSIADLAEESDSDLAEARAQVAHAEALADDLSEEVRDLLSQLEESHGEIARLTETQAGHSLASPKDAPLPPGPIALSVSPSSVRHMDTGINTESPRLVMSHVAIDTLGLATSTHTGSNTESPRLGMSHVAIDTLGLAISTHTGSDTHDLVSSVSRCSNTGDLVSAVRVGSDTHGLAKPVSAGSDTHDLITSVSRCSDTGDLVSAVHVGSDTQGLAMPVSAGSDTHDLTTSVSRCSGTSDLIASAHAGGDTSDLVTCLTSETDTEGLVVGSDKGVDTAGLAGQVDQVLSMGVQQSSGNGDLASLVASLQSVMQGLESFDTIGRERSEETTAALFDLLDAHVLGATQLEEKITQLSSALLNSAATHAETEALLTARVAEVEAELVQATEEKVSQLSSALLTSAHKHAKTEETLADQLLAVQAVLATAEEDKAALAAQVVVLQAKVERVKKDRLRKLSSALLSCSQGYAESEATYADQLAALQARLTTAEEDKEALAAQVEDLEAKLVQVTEERVPKLSSALLSCSLGYAETEAMLAELQATQAEQEAKLEQEKEDKVSQLSSALVLSAQGHAATEAVLAEKLATAEEEKAALVAKVEALEAKVGRVKKDRLRKLSSALLSCSQGYAESEATYSEQLAAVQARLTTAEGDKEALAAQVEGLEAKLVQVTEERVPKLSSALLSCSQGYAETEAMLAEAQATQAEQEAKLEQEKEDKISQLSSALVLSAQGHAATEAVLAEKLATVQGQLEEEKGAKAALVSRLEEVEAELRHLKEEVPHLASALETAQEHAETEVIIAEAILEVQDLVKDEKVSQLSSALLTSALGHAETEAVLADELEAVKAGHSQAAAEMMQQNQESQEKVSQLSSALLTSAQAHAETEAILVGELEAVKAEHSQASAEMEQANQESQEKVSQLSSALLTSAQAHAETEAILVGELEAVKAEHSQASFEMEQANQESQEKVSQLSSALPTSAQAHAETEAILVGELEAVKAEHSQASFEMEQESQDKVSQLYSALLASAQAHAEVEATLAEQLRAVQAKLEQSEVELSELEATAAAEAQAKVMLMTKLLETESELEAAAEAVMEMEAELAAVKELAAENEWATVKEVPGPGASSVTEVLSPLIYKLVDAFSTAMEADEQAEKLQQGLESCFLLSALNAGAPDATDKVAKLSRELESATAEVMSLTTQLKSAKKEGEDFSNKLERASRQEVTLKGELVDAATKLESLSRELEIGKKQEMLDPAAKAEASSEDGEALRRQLEEGTARLEAMTEELRISAKEVQELKQERAEVQERERVEMNNVGEQVVREELGIAIAKVVMLTQELEALKAEAVSLKEAAGAMRFEEAATADNLPMAVGRRVDNAVFADAEMVALQDLCLELRLAVQAREADVSSLQEAIAAQSADAASAAEDAKNKLRAAIKKGKGLETKSKELEARVHELEAELNNADKVPVPAAAVEGISPTSSIGSPEGEASELNLKLRMAIKKGKKLDEQLAAANEQLTAANAALAAAGGAAGAMGGAGSRNVGATAENGESAQKIASLEKELAGARKRVAIANHLTAHVGELGAQIDSLQDAVKDARADAAAAREAQSSLQAELAALENSRAQLEAEFEAEMGEAEDAASQAQQEVAELSSQLEDVQAAMEVVMMQKDSLEAQLQQELKKHSQFEVAQKLVSDAETQVLMKNSELARMAAQIKRLEKEVASIEASMSNDLAAATERAVQAEEQCAAALQHAQVAEAAAEAAQATVVEVEEEAMAMGRELDDLTRKSETDGQRLKRDLASCKTALEISNQDMEQYKAQCQKLKAQLAAAMVGEATSVDLQQQLNSAEKAAAEATRRLKEAEQLLDDSQGELIGSRMRVEELEAKFHKAGAATPGAANASSSSRLSELADDLADTSARLEEANFDIERLREQISNNESQRGQDQQKLHQARETIMKLQQDRTSLQVQLEEAKTPGVSFSAGGSGAGHPGHLLEQVDELAAELEQAQAQVLELSGELATAKQELEDVSAELAALGETCREREVELVQALSTSSEQSAELADVRRALQLQEAELAEALAGSYGAKEAADSQIFKLRAEVEDKERQILSLQLQVEAALQQQASSRDVDTGGDGESRPLLISSALHSRAVSTNDMALAARQQSAEVVHASHDMGASLAELHARLARMVVNIGFGNNLNEFTPDMAEAVAATTQLGMVVGVLEEGMQQYFIQIQQSQTEHRARNAEQVEAFRSKVQFLEVENKELLYMLNEPLAAKSSNIYDSGGAHPGDEQPQATATTPSALSNRTKAYRYVRDSELGSTAQEIDLESGLGASTSTHEPFSALSPSDMTPTPLVPGTKLRVSDSGKSSPTGNPLLAQSDSSAKKLTVEFLPLAAQPYVRSLHPRLRQAAALFDRVASHTGALLSHMPNVRLTILLYLVMEHLMLWGFLFSRNHHHGCASDEVVSTG